MFGNELDRLLYSYRNSLAMLDPTEKDFDYRRTIIEEQMEDIFRHEQIMNERRQLARNRAEFEEALTRAKEEEESKKMANY